MVEKMSITGEECWQQFDNSRVLLMARYRTAVTKAFVNASKLETTTLPVLQTYTFSYRALRTRIGSHTLWTPTGIAILMAKRIGLHRDGESQELSLFITQMRR